MDLFSSDIDEDLLFDTDFENFNSNQFPFSFPFKPYAEQEKLMAKLYSVLDEGKIGIIESPTGTVLFNISPQFCLYILIDY
jgi:chromosome transmission fidelity protein 1